MILMRLRYIMCGPFLMVEEFRPRGTQGKSSSLPVPQSLTTFSHALSRIYTRGSV